MGQATSRTRRAADDETDLIGAAGFVRDDVDIVRVVAYAIALLIAVTYAVTAQPIGSGALGRLLYPLADAPSWLRGLLLTLTQITAIAGPIAVVTALRHRVRLVVTALLAAGLAAVVVWLLEDWALGMIAGPPRGVSAISWLNFGGFGTGGYLSGLVAGAVVLGPATRRDWYRPMVLALTAIALVPITIGATPAFFALLVALTGSVAGAILLLINGIPRRQVSRSALIGALTDCGIQVAHLAPLSSTGGGPRFLVTTPDGRELVAKFRADQQRNVEVFARMVRAVLVKDLNDERVNWTQRELADHEALCGLTAGARGVQVEPVVTAAHTEFDDGVVVFEYTAGTTFEDLPDDELDEHAIAAAFTQLVRLHDAGMAHRWCSLAHLRRGEDGVVRLTDFGWATRQATPDQFSADIAAMIIAFALRVGAQQAVTGAVRGAGRDRVIAALPLIQPLTLPDDTRGDTKEHKELLKQVRAQIETVTGCEPAELAPIDRINWTKIIGLIGAVAISYGVLTFAAHWTQVQGALRTMNSSSLPILIALAFVPYLTGTAMFRAVVPAALPGREVLLLMLGQSFLNRFTPANAGGMALRVRYLQARGFTIGDAASALALTSFAASVGMVAVLGIFALWTGSSDTLNFDLPDASTVALVLVALTLVASIVWFTPWGRRKLASRLDATLRQFWSTLKVIATDPRRLMLLFGLATLNKLLEVFSFIIACRALHIDVAMPILGVLYLTGTAIGNASPTPGGVGAVEAALTAALTGAGVAFPPALAAVFLFRAVQYWLPVPFCWLAYRRLGTILNQLPSATVRPPLPRRA